jgi:LuxR family maltose regulon positive regulatory protein
VALSTYPLRKIERPELRATDLPRPALARELRAALTTRGVVLLCAPAGFGKTTALVSALAGLPADVTATWVEVDDLDDLGRLSACALGALEPLDLPWRVSPESLVAALDGGSATRTAWAVALANALHGSSAARGVLVLDALDRCEDPAVFSFIDALLQAWPRHWTLALTSRVEPPLALARWHVQEEVAEFRQDVLRLDAEELSALWDSNTAPSAAALQALQDLTQGWPAAAALLLHAQRGSVHAGSVAPALEGTARRRLFAYLGSEVLAHLPAALAEFLVRCAVLPEWDAARCQAVSGRSDAALLLEQMQQRALFGHRVGAWTDATGSPTAWAPDPLFLSFLEEQLQHRYPGEWPALMQRAAASEPDATRRVDLLPRAGLAQLASQAVLEATPQWLEEGNALHLSHVLERFPQSDRDMPSWHAARAQLAWGRWDWAAMDDAATRAERGYARADHAALAAEARSLRAVARIGMSDLDGAAALLAEGDASSTMQRLAQATAQAWLAHARGPAAAAAAWQDRVTDLLVDTEAASWLWLQCAPNFRMATMPGLGDTVLRFVREALRKAGDEPTPLPRGVDPLLLAAAVARRVRSGGAWLRRGQPGGAVDGPAAQPAVGRDQRAAAAGGAGRPCRRGD